MLPQVIPVLFTLIISNAEIEFSQPCYIYHESLPTPLLAYQLAHFPQLPVLAIHKLFIYGGIVDNDYSRAKWKLNTDNMSEWFEIMNEWCGLYICNK